MLDVAIVVGHDALAQGATAVDGMREWEFFRPVADQVVDDLRKRGVEARVFLRPTGGTYKSKMRELCDAINDADPRIAVELHFNVRAPGYPKTSALHWPGSRRAASASWTLASSVATGLKDPRSYSVWARKRSWSMAEDLDGDGTLDPAGPPMYFLSLTRCPAVILETHYADDADDHKLVQGARDSGTLARHVAAAIAGVLKGWEG